VITLLTLTDYFLVSLHARCGNLLQIRSQIIRDRKLLIDLTLQLTTKQHWAVSGAELRNALFNDWPEMSHEALDGPGGGITEGTNRAAFHLLSKVWKGRLVVDSAAARMYGTHVSSKSMSISR
jgi:hypothetical protein